MKRTHWLLLCHLVVFMLIPVPAATAADELSHVLQKGETLYSVSQKYNVPPEAIAAVNGITDSSKLKAGTILVIPSVHVVVKGETFYGIARVNGITVDSLLAANKLDKGYILQIGDILFIPSATSAAEAGAQGPAPATATTTALKPNASTTTTVKAVAATTTTTVGVVALTTTTTAKAAAAATTTTLKPNAATPTTIPPGDARSAVPVTTSTSGTTGQAPASTYAPIPEPVRTNDRSVDPKLAWPANGQAYYLDGKLEGVMIRVKPGETAKAIASGTVVSAGPSRGFGQVVFVQSRAGYVYVYGGNENLLVKTGDSLDSGREIGRIGLDAKDNSPVAYFFVFRNGQSIDPALAPRD